jgi:hypothetical protein
VTSPCPGGSQPAAGAPAFFSYAESDLLQAFGAYAGWLTTWAMGLPSTPQVTSTFCAMPPPTELPTAADWVALAVPPAALISGAYRRLGNWVIANKWSQLCVCSQSGTDTPCGDSGSLHGVIDPHPNGFSQIGPLTPIPSGTSQLSLNINVHCGNATGQNGLFGIRCFNSSGGRIADIDRALPALTPFGWHQNVPISTVYLNVSRVDGLSTTLPAGTVAVQPIVSTPGLNRGDLTADSIWSWNCSSSSSPVPPPVAVPPPAGYPLPPVQGPCTTIGDLCAVVHDLGVKLDLLWGAAPPPIHSYAEGFRHSNLSGDGTLNLSGDAIAYRVEIVTDNPALGQLVGTPPYLLDRGFLVAITPEGAERTQVRLVYNPQLIELPLSAVRLGYHFGPGVIANVVELLRGP